jgi:Lon protease-like protein
MSPSVISLDVQARLKSLPVFPLPNAVLLPGGQLPLHIFEPRYRRLVQDCLEADRMMAVGLLAPEGRRSPTHSPRIHPTIGLGYIHAHERLPDGRYLIVLLGLLRTRILRELPSRQPYRLVQAEVLEDMSGNTTDSMRTSASVLRQIVTRLARNLPEDVGDPLVKAVSGVSDPGRLADLVAAVALSDPMQRQRFLEELDVPRRLDSITEVVARVVSQMPGPDDAPAAN